MSLILWANYIEDKTFVIDGTGTRTKVINRERKQTLSGRDYTASVISEILTLAGQLNNDTYIKLAKARKVRNSWLHNLTSISSMMAAECIQTAQTLVKEVSGIELLVNLSHSSRL